MESGRGGGWEGSWIERGKGRFAGSGEGGTIFCSSVLWLCNLVFLSFLLAAFALFPWLYRFLRVPFSSHCRTRENENPPRTLLRSISRASLMCQKAEKTRTSGEQRRSLSVSPSSPFLETNTNHAISIPSKPIPSQKAIPKPKQSQERKRRRRTGPGLTALTVALSASSLLHVRVMASSAALVPP